MASPVTVPYDDYNKLVKDAEDRASIVQLLGTSFPDDTCMLIAIKSVLNIPVQTTSTTTTTTT